MAATATGNLAHQSLLDCPSPEMEPYGSLVAHRCSLSFLPPGFMLTDVSSCAGSPPQAATCCPTLLSLQEDAAQRDPHLFLAVITQQSLNTPCRQVSQCDGKGGRACLVPWAGGREGEKGEGYETSMLSVTACHLTSLSLPFPSGPISVCFQEGSQHPHQQEAERRGKAVQLGKRQCLLPPPAAPPRGGRRRAQLLPCQVPAGRGR